MTEDNNSMPVIANLSKRYRWSPNHTEKCSEPYIKKSIHDEAIAQACNKQECISKKMAVKLISQVKHEAIAQAKRETEALNELYNLCREYETELFWTHCDCGCPGKEAPRNKASVKIIRILAAIKAIGEDK